MNLLQNEIKIGSTNDDKIVLTNFRIFQQEQKFGSNYHLSLHLEDISSIEMHYKSSPILLILGILFSFLGIYTLLMSNFQDTLVLAILFIGILFLLAWWFTRRFAVSIKPNGGRSLDCFFEATSNEAINSFLNLLEQAKLARVNQLSFSAPTISPSISPLHSSITSSLSKKCPSCNYSILENDVFCENCGNKLK